jgi:DNA-directed RNA polymerase subunit M/transcription elongation factor TFIIS
MRIIENPQQFRERLQAKLKEQILCSDAAAADTATVATVATVEDTTASKIAINLERGIYNFILQKSSRENIVKKWDNPYFVQVYLDHTRSVFCNLKNPRILDAVRTAAIKAQDLPFMTHQELCPEKWTQLIEEKRIRDKNKYEIKLEASTDNFQCRKCKSRECTYYQLQTRSADEPMTTFVTCITCGSRWKC